MAGAGLEVVPSETTGSVPGAEDGSGEAVELAGSVPESIGAEVGAGLVPELTGAEVGAGLVPELTGAEVGAGSITELTGAEVGAGTAIGTTVTAGTAAEGLWETGSVTGTGMEPDDQELTIFCSRAANR